MTFEEALREVESQEFAVRLNIASDFRTFKRVARTKECVRALLRFLALRKEREKIFVHIIELSSQQVDPRYENVWDTPLAIYVWLINQRDFELGRIAAEAVVNAPQCWWAWKAAYYIRREDTTRNATGGEGREGSFPSFIEDKPTGIYETGEAILSSNLSSTLGRTFRIQLSGPPKLENSLLSEGEDSLTSPFLRALMKNNDGETISFEKRIEAYSD